jgi:hypothetical protein
MSTTISGDLVAHLRQILQNSVEYAKKGKGIIHEYNAYSPNAISGYVIAVAAFESFINEILLGPMTKKVFNNSSIWHLSKDSIEKMELKIKTIILPQLLFGNTFLSNNQPFQDFAMLIKVRNDIVHYKFKTEPKYVEALVGKNIAISASKHPGDADYPWPQKLSTTEGIRWAHNTICKMVFKLGTFIPPDKRRIISFEHMSGNFKEIPIEEVGL